MTSLLKESDIGRSRFRTRKWEECHGGLAPWRYSRSWHPASPTPSISGAHIALGVR